jgi:hypothetical protein
MVSFQGPGSNQVTIENVFTTAPDDRATGTGAPPGNRVVRVVRGGGHCYLIQAFDRQNPINHPSQHGGASQVQ